MKTVDTSHPPERPHPPKPPLANPFTIVPSKLSRDPVCGMNVDPAQAAGSLVQQGTTYHFCSKGCLARFAANPAKYLHHDVQPDAMTEVMASPSTGNANAAADYTCPMHPEIVQKGPGTCPLCGMALEPKEVSAEAPDDSELRDMTRRFSIAAAFTAPILTLGMFGLLPAWTQAFLATPVVLWCGWPVFERFWMSLVHRSPNMFTLIGLGTGVAYLASLIVLIFPNALPHDVRGHNGGVPLYFEAAASIITLVLLGQVLELRARGRTSAAIRQLLSLAPSTAHLVLPTGDLDIDLAHVGAGAVLRVRPGENVPVDGKVAEGTTAINESMITGEPMPVAKGPGDSVTGGTVNGTGSFVMRAERVGAETLLSQIVKLVNEAQRSRAPIQRLADQLAAVFVPAVVAVAVLTFFLWGWFGPEPRWIYGAVNAVAVLIIACPCALGLATPMSIMVGFGRGAQAGVLFRNAEALETLAKVNTLIVDKTGTLTEGKPRVVGVEPESILPLAAALERSSEHPLAAAIRAAAPDVQLKIEDFRAIPGQGVTGRIEGKLVALGNRRLIPNGSSPDTTATVVFVAIDGEPSGYILIEDPIRSTTPDALNGLKQAGVEVIMATGDRKPTAAAVAAKLGIARVEAEMLPASKAALVDELAKTRTVAMAGDGINDAPALARAAVGIALGTGSGIAVESAGVTLVQGDLRGILRARRLSLAVTRNIRQNLFFAFAYNLIGVPVAAGVLYPMFGILLSPTLAALAMTFSSVSVISNALRLRRQPL